MFSLIAQAQRLLPIDIVVELYDQLLLPILLHGSEIWGFSDISAIEVMYRNVLRGILKLNRSTANCMVYGELGKCCIMNSVKERMVNLCSRLVTSKQSKISYIMYRVVKLLHDRDDIPFQSDWIGNVKNILCESGFTFVWLQQKTVNPKWLKGLLHKRLADINRQKWHNEPYITLLNTRQRITMCKFRCGNTNIPIVSGRYQTVNRSERTCNLCDAGVAGN